MPLTREAQVLSLEVRVDIMKLRPKPAQCAYNVMKEVMLDGTMDCA